MFDLEEDRVVREVERRGAGRVLVQLPEGLKHEGLKIAATLEARTGATIIVSADPCYGGCDLAEDDVEALQADLLIHYGHSSFLSGSRIPVLYVEAKAHLSTAAAVRKSIALLSGCRTIGLVAVIQHIDNLEEASGILAEAGKTVKIGQPMDKASYRGQVLGCDYSSALSIAGEVDAFLLLSGGDFHALGLALSTDKKVVVADPYVDEAREVGELKRKLLMQRWARITAAKEAKKIGVVVGLKPGQQNLDLALEVKRMLEETGRVAVLFSMRDLTPERLYSFPDVGAFIVTLCPRIAIDDASRFSKPVLTTREAFVLVGRMSWEDYAP